MMNDGGSALDALAKAYSFTDEIKRLEEQPCFGITKKLQNRCGNPQLWGDVTRQQVKHAFDQLASIDPRKEPKLCADILKDLYPKIFCRFHGDTANCLIKEWVVSAKKISQQLVEEEVHASLEVFDGFRPYKMRISASSANAFQIALENAIKGNFTTCGPGYIYAFRHPHHPEYIKIGRTSDLKQRIKWHKKHLGLKNEELEFLPGISENKMQSVECIERIIHTELDSERFELLCACSEAETHIEWFKVDEVRLCEVTKVWQEWADTEPYETISVGTGLCEVRLTVAAEGRLKELVANAELRRRRRSPDQSEGELVADENAATGSPTVQSCLRIAAPLTPPASPGSAISAVANPLGKASPIAPADLPTPPPSTKEERVVPILESFSISETVFSERNEPLPYRKETVINGSIGGQTQSGKGFSIGGSFYFCRSNSKEPDGVTQQKSGTVVREKEVTDKQESNEIPQSGGVTVMDDGTDAQVISSTEAESLTTDSQNKTLRSGRILKQMGEKSRQGLDQGRESISNLMTNIPEVKGKLKDMGGKLRGFGKKLRRRTESIGETQTSNVDGVEENLEAAKIEVSEAALDTKDEQAS